MKNFIIFYAPFIVLILAILFSFWTAPKDVIIIKKNEEIR